MGIELKGVKLSEWTVKEGDPIGDEYKNEEGKKVIARLTQEGADCLNARRQACFFGDLREEELKGKKVVLKVTPIRDKAVFDRRKPSVKAGLNRNPF